MLKCAIAYMRATLTPQRSIVSARLTRYEKKQLHLFQEEENIAGMEKIWSVAPMCFYYGFRSSQYTPWHSRQINLTLRFRATFLQLKRGIQDSGLGSCITKFKKFMRNSRVHKIRFSRILSCLQYVL